MSLATIPIDDLAPRPHLQPGEYLHLIKLFVDKGDVVEMKDDVAVFQQDELLVYLAEIMRHPFIQAKVLSSRLAGQIFYETVGRFVLECLHAEQFANQRVSGERGQVEKTREWSMQKRKDAWQSLIERVGEQHEEDGFDIDFLKKRFHHDGWKDPGNWDLLRHEWKHAIDNRVLRQTTEHFSEKKSLVAKRLQQQLNYAQKLRNEGVSEEQALQAWTMMEGQWTETEFEKKLNIVKIQNQYPEIGEVVKRMGRMTDTDGKDRMLMQTGRSQRLSHSAGSDIEGVSIGRDLNALMPLELAQCTDDDMEKLFLHKYTASKLQVFHYKSEMANPARSLRSERASRRGPMIVCVDSSASMSGVPQKIEASLLARLELVAETLNRDCFLIDFSVGIHPIELRARQQKRSMQRMGMRMADQMLFKAGTFPFIGGGTDAQKMLNLTFALLDNKNDRYMNADVLWITDFLIPRTDKKLMECFKEYQRTGTKFYGFKIGDGHSDWEQYFDKIYEVKYVQPRRY